ncbi:MAG: efflux RND transporter periplasmic adaptor subunit [Bryobacteraceae bacterium]|nr:efflux RND transporter periplasmic adaptor subunit [Bryobacteraceae bacterium]
MKKPVKIWLSIGVAAILAGSVYYGVNKSQADIVTVQTGKVIRQDLTATVTASGEIRPRNYVNIGANVMGRLTEILVKEGDRVTKGQLLAKLESVQAGADVNAQLANLSAAQAEVTGAEAALKAADESLRTLKASVDRARAELQRANLDFERSQQLYAERLIAKQEFDLRRAQAEAAAATLREAEARLAQAEAQRMQTAASLASAQKRVAQIQASLVRVKDVLNKHLATSPIDGIVTNLPVRVGETVVPGIQNSPASLIMTIADMSLITAEVKVDEADIVSIQNGQIADITIDALPNRTFKGHVIEIGNTAILRSTGLAASQSAISSQEAKDFKVVIALDNPPPEIRPGLSCTAKITTATRSNVLSIPIQALTVRQKGDLLPKPKKGVQAAAATDPAKQKELSEEVQGVFVVQDGKAVFRKVDTGITGATYIELLGGLKEGDEIITGSYRVIRTLRNETRVKIDNRTETSKAL